MAEFTSIFYTRQLWITYKLFRSTVKQRRFLAFSISALTLKLLMYCLFIIRHVFCRESSAQTDGKDKPEGKTIPSISGRRNHLTILKARSSTFGAPGARQLNNFKAKHRKSGHRASGSRHGATLKNISDERLAAYGLGTKRKRSKQ